MPKIMRTVKRLQKQPLMILFVVSSVIFIWTAWIASSQVMTGWEMSWFGAINQMSNSLRWLGLVVSQFGDVAVFATLVLAFLLFDRRRIAARIFLAGGAAFVLVEVAKRLVGRPRPVDLVEPVYTRIHETGMGFPSGHTAMATALSLTLAFSLGKHWRWLPFVWIPLVAVDRIYLGVHAPLDVVGGFAIGGMVVSFVMISERLWKKLAVKA